jgi:hypothetical protein
MSHSPAYYHNGAHVSSAPFSGYGAPLSYVHQPPGAPLHQRRRSLSPVAASPASQRSSESDRYPKLAGAVNPQLSDVGKDSSQSTSPHPFPFPSDVNRGSNNHRRNRSSNRYSGRDGTVPSQGSFRPDLGSAEYNTTIYTYPPRIDGVERTADHAVLVLVSPNKESHRYRPLTCRTALARLL